MLPPLHCPTFSGFGFDQSATTTSTRHNEAELDFRRSRHTPDSGAVSDIYTGNASSASHVTSSPFAQLSPRDIDDDDINYVIPTHGSCDVRNRGSSHFPSLADSVVMTSERTCQVEVDTFEGEGSGSSECSEDDHMSVASRGLPWCPDCQCKLSLYQLITRSLERKQQQQQMTSRNHVSSSTSGFLFIVADSSATSRQNSDSQNFRIASSRDTHDYTLNNHVIGGDLVFRAKVKQPVEACRVLQASVAEFGVGGGWYRCALRTIVNRATSAARQFTV